MELDLLFVNVTYKVLYQRTEFKSILSRSNYFILCDKGETSNWMTSEESKYQPGYSHVTYVVSPCPRRPPSPQPQENTSPLADRAK